MVKTPCGGKLQRIKISLWAEISLRRAVSGHEDFHAENFMGMNFFPMDASTLMAEVLHTPSLVGHQARASSHGSALHWTHLQGGFCLPPGTNKPLWQL